ncbi:MAG: thrombospondin type 3 repeat-containing protein [Gammaproteobacteria bacterium]|nr:thrombospondin type 3 repeat-containing protein [Gammaproteobacteria bacterium]NND61396.1 hypothetical protein [Gammaproteobacteria bacterium]
MFGMGSGRQMTNTMSVNHYVWPVRDGDVLVDTDNDGIEDHLDNCPQVANTDQLDSDGDGVGNGCDNCVSDSNADQCDTNADGFGNICDADLDNNGIVNSFDLSLLRDNFGQSGANDADINCNGVVNSFDLTLMRNGFGQPPG